METSELFFRKMNINSRTKLLLTLGMQKTPTDVTAIPETILQKSNDMDTNISSQNNFNDTDAANRPVLSCGEVPITIDSVRRFSGLYTGPYFDPQVPTNITSQLGTHAYLPCKVKQLGNKSVSWIRKRDAHILTVDRYTFIADERFQSFFVEATNTWTLQVKYVQPRDAGEYECQVSTEPKMSQFIKLNVVIPKIEIIGESEMYVKAGSTVNLRCVISRSLEEPAYIFWYRDSERVLNYDKTVIDIRMERIGSDTTIGTLVIYNSKKEDSGNYSCSPSNLDSASVLLHVLNGEQPAAMQHGNSVAESRAMMWIYMSLPLAMIVSLREKVTMLIYGILYFLIACHESSEENDKIK